MTDAVEMTAALQRQDLATVIHLCEGRAGNAYARAVEKSFPAPGGDTCEIGGDVRARRRRDGARHLKRNQLRLPTAPLDAAVSNTTRIV
jgi:hypothetical protein